MTYTDLQAEVLAKCADTGNWQGELNGLAVSLNTNVSTLIATLGQLRAAGHVEFYTALDNGNALRPGHRITQIHIDVTP